MNVNIPLLRLVSGNTPKHVSQSAVGHLGLFVSLRVASATIVQGRIKSPSQSSPEKAKELDVSVRGNCLRNTMQPNYFSKEEMGYVGSIRGLPAKDIVYHFGEPINDYKNRIHTSLGPQKSEHKTHTQVFPNSLRHW
jgi:hypothetical protein